MRLPIGSPLGIAIGNPIESLIEPPNTGAVIGSLVGFLAGTILGNQLGSLTGSSVGISPTEFLGDWTGYLLGIFTGTLLGYPLGFQFGSESNRYWPSCRSLADRHMACSFCDNICVLVGRYFLWPYLCSCYCFQHKSVRYLQLLDLLTLAFSTAWLIPSYEGRWIAVGLDSTGSTNLTVGMDED